MKKVLFPILALVLALGLALPMAAGASPDPGIVALWHFDERVGSIAGDSSGYSNDGTLSGGKFGNALEFDGVDDYVQVADDETLDITGAITMECWVKREQAAYQTLIAKWGAADDQRSYLLSLTSDNKVRFWTTSAGTWGTLQQLTSSGTVATEWTHIAATYDGTTMKIYINGDKDGNEVSTTISIFGGTASLMFGVHPAYMTHGWVPAYFKGTIDEVRISSIARATFDLTQAPSVDGDTVALWHFDESVGTTAYDCSGNGNDGTINGAKWAGPTWVDGKFGNALSFDGVDDYVEVGDDVSLNPLEITIEAWIKPSSWPTTNAVALVTKRTKYGDGYFLFYYEGSTQTINFDWGGWSGSNRWNTGYAPPLNTWTHLAVTRDSAGRALYVDGDLYASTPYAGAPASTGAPLRIGCDSRAGYEGHYPFHGMIDEVRIWNEALTADQITLSYSGSVGWLPPVTNADFVLKDGTTLPLKFQLYENDSLVTIVQPVFLEVADGNGSVHRYELGDGVDNLRWNADESYYIANLKTKDGTWPPGEYEYTATVGGIVTGSIPFELSPEKGVGRGNSGK